MNSLLLSIFTNNSKRYTLELQSIFSRYEALSVIYVNLIVSSIVCSYDLLVWILLTPSKNDLKISSTCPVLFLSFILLKKGKEKGAIIASIFYMHFVNLFIGRVAEHPMTGLCGQIFIANFSFFLYSSPKAGTFNLILCLIQFFGHASKILDIFQYTIDDGQLFQIHTFLIAQFACLFSIPMLFLVRKSVETNMWKIAQNNYTKSENLTKGIVQAVETNDSFLLSLSEEMKKILASVEKSLSHLTQVVQKTNHNEEVKNIKASIGFLLNILDNALDSAKLRSGRMQDAAREANLADTLRKTFTKYAEILQWSNVSLRVMIDKSMPQRIWTDSCRVVQIITNIIFNELQFTPHKGSIEVYATWCQETVNQDDLLRPIKETEESNTLRENNASNRTERLVGDQSLQLDRRHTSSAEEFFQEFIGTESKDRIKNFTSIKTFPAKHLEDVVNSSRIPAVSWNIQESQDLRSLGRSLQYIPGAPSSQDRGSERKGYLKIQIIDKRYKIPQDDLAILFGVPNQPNNTSRYTSGGIGLRLWICKQLCLKMGGDIKAESKTNEGTTFMFYIPIDNSRFFEPLQPDRSRRGATTALVIDDSTFDRSLLKILLEKEGVEVTVATDDKAALEAFRKQGSRYFDFIMIGIQTPELNGFKAARQIREYEKRLRKEQPTDICFVSGEHFDEYEILKEYKGREKMSDTTGMKGLMKPLDLGLLKKALAKYKKNEGA